MPQFISQINEPFKFPIEIIAPDKSSVIVQQSNQVINRPGAITCSTILIS